MTTTQSPKCHVPGHGNLVRRALTNATPEVRFCGEWWDCPDPRCGTTLLIPSPELTVQLDQQRAAAASQQKCAGVGKPAIAGKGQKSCYPHCPACGREFSAQGRKAIRRYANAWGKTPVHFVTADGL